MHEPLIQRLRDTAQMRGQLPDWLLDELTNAADALQTIPPQPAALRDGWVAVPAVIPLSEDDAQSIAFFIGNKEGGFNEATLFVGVVIDDDGGEHYGLAIRSADYPEEGAIMLHEFAAAPKPEISR